MDRLELFNIEELPRGTPSERPLLPKKRRLWNPVSTTIHHENVASTLSAPPTVEHEVEFVEVKPACYCTTGLKKEMELSMSSSSVYAPSPACFIECGGSGSSSVVSTPTESVRRHIHPSRHRRRALDDRDTKDVLNYGSESDSDESGDEEPLVSAVLPRVVREAMDTPEDEEPERFLPPAPVEVADLLDSITTPEQGATMLPHDLFCFQWEQFPNPPIPPSERREPFTSANVGPTTPCVNGYDVFTAIWDQQIMDHIVVETNRYAQEVATLKFTNNTLGPTSRIAFWKDTTRDELYVYFAIVLAMGVVVKSNLTDYWETNTNIFLTPGFSAHMSLRRFQLLNTCLHFNNNSDMCVENLTPSEAKLFKIEPVLTHLNNKFQTLYNLNRNIALDESLLQWKGWLNINQFIPNKAATVGIKTYEICESETGYLWRFEVHAHKKTSPVAREQQTPLDASTPAIVLRLVNGLENKGHTLWMDNFYNSPVLARRLKSIGFDVVGTLRTNRQYIPDELAKLTKANMRPGQITGCTSGDVDLMVWRDQNRVATISTYHGNAIATTDGKTKPTLIHDYNIMMGGVDKKDQMLAMYPIERKRTAVWYKKLFRRLLNVSVLNSFVICRKSNLSSSHRAFRCALVSSLLSRHSTGSVKCPVRQNVSFHAKTHYIAQRPVGHNKSRLRRVCCVCKRLTQFYCVGCTQSVCISTCFVSLHT